MHHDHGAFVPSSTVSCALKHECVWQLPYTPAGSYSKMSLNHVPTEAAFACLTHLFLLAAALVTMHKAMRQTHVSQQDPDEATTREAARLASHIGVKPAPCCSAEPLTCLLRLILI